MSWDKCNKFNCVAETILTPGSDWNISGGIAVAGENFTIGSAGQQDGVAEYSYATPVGRRGTKHVFGFDLGAVTAGGNDIALRVEVEQGGEIFEFEDLLTTESVQNIELEFFPTADVIIRIRDTSTGSQGSNRDASVRAMQLVTSCEGRSLVTSSEQLNPVPLITAPAAQNYVDIGTTRLQWGVIDHLDSADGGTVILPVPFADANYVVQYTLSESTAIEGPAADVGVNVWTENLTPTQFGHNRDNDIDFAHVHWFAIGRKAAALDAGPQFSNLSSGQLVSDFTQDNNGNLQVNLRNTTAVALFWEIYVQDVPYSTVEEETGVYTVRTRDNGDGTFNHVLAGVNPLSGFANLVVGPAAIDINGNGNPTISFYFEVDANSI